MSEQAWIQMIIGVFAAATLIFVFLPGGDLDPGADKTRLAYLYERKEVVYENLRDLNFEFKAGKFATADFEIMRTNMEGEAARLLAEIDRLETAGQRVTA